MVLAFLGRCVSREMQSDWALVKQIRVNFPEEILMKLVLIALGLFFLAFSALAGTFLDTFDDGKLVGWQTLVMFGFEDPGSWEIIDGELQGISNAGTITRLLTIGRETWQDYDIEFEVKPLKKHGPGNVAIAARIEGTWGVVCEIEDSNQGAPAAGCFGGNLHGDFFLNYAQEPHPLLRLQKWSTLKLSVHGNQLTFWINGERVLDPITLKPLHGFPDFPAGRVGLGIANYTARFDNFKVTGPGIPDRNRLSVTPHVKLATVWGNLKRF